MAKNILLIFDIDGTLTDTVTMYHEIFNETLSELGFNNYNRNFNEYKHHTDSFVVNEINRNQSEKRKSIIDDFEHLIYSKIKNRKIIEIEGAKKLIDSLSKSENLTICYATGSVKLTAQYKLQKIGVDFSEYQLNCSNHLEERENILLEAIEKAKNYKKLTHFDQIISVGDGIWDLITAKNLNIEFIGIGLKNKNILLENGMTKWFENLTNFKI